MVTTSETASTCPRTKCPDTRPRHSRARSRFTSPPRARPPRFVTASVSAERSATSVRPGSTAVTQTPDTATLSPRRNAPKREGGWTVKRVPPLRFRAMEATRPIPVTIPVNIGDSLPTGGAPPSPAGPRHDAGHEPVLPHPFVLDLHDAQGPFEREALPPHAA